MVGTGDRNHLGGLGFQAAHINVVQGSAEGGAAQVRFEAQWFQAMLQQYPIHQLLPTIAPGVEIACQDCRSPVRDKEFQQGTQLLLQVFQANGEVDGMQVDSQ